MTIYIIISIVLLVLLAALGVALFGNRPKWTGRTVTTLLALLLFREFMLITTTRGSWDTGGVVPGVYAEGHRLGVQAIQGFCRDTSLIVIGGYVVLFILCLHCFYSRGSKGNEKGKFQ